MAAQKKTPEEIAEEQRKKEESLARYKRELIQSIEEWLEKIRSGDYTVDKVELQARKGCITMGLQYPKKEYSRY